MITIDTQHFGVSILSITNTSSTNLTPYALPIRISPRLRHPTSFVCPRHAFVTRYRPIWYRPLPLSFALIIRSRSSTFVKLIIVSYPYAVHFLVSSVYPLCPLRTSCVTPAFLMFRLKFEYHSSPFVSSSHLSRIIRIRSYVYRISRAYYCNRYTSFSPYTNIDSDASSSTYIIPLINSLFLPSLYQPLQYASC